MDASYRLSIYFREKFIPITRRSVMRHLMQEPGFLSEQELEHFEHFALALDSAIVNRYHYLLQELKVIAMLIIHTQNASNGSNFI